MKIILRHMTDKTLKIHLCDTFKSNIEPTAQCVIKNHHIKISHIKTISSIPFSKYTDFLIYGNEPGLNPELEVLLKTIHAHIKQCKITITTYGKVFNQDSLNHLAALGVSNIISYIKYQDLKHYANLYPAIKAVQHKIDIRFALLLHRVSTIDIHEIIQLISNINPGVRLLDTVLITPFEKGLFKKISSYSLLKKRYKTVKKLQAELFLHGYLIESLSNNYFIPKIRLTYLKTNHMRKKIKIRNVNKIIVFRTFSKMESGIGDIILAAYAMIKLKDVYECPIYFFIPNLVSNYRLDRETARILNFQDHSFLTYPMAEYLPDPFIKADDDILILSLADSKLLQISKKKNKVVQTIAFRDNRRLANNHILNDFIEKINSFLPFKLNYINQTEQYLHLNFPNPLETKISTLIHMSSSTNEKNIPLLEIFFLILHLINQENNPIVLIGKSSTLRGYRMFKKFIERLGKKQRNIFDLIDQTSLEKSVQLISECNLYIGPDTGLTHFASMMDKPLVSPEAENKSFNPINKKSITIPKKANQITSMDLVLAITELDQANRDISLPNIQNHLTNEQKISFSHYNLFVDITNMLEQAIDKVLEELCLHYNIVYNETSCKIETFSENQKIILWFDRMLEIKSPDFYFLLGFISFPKLLEDPGYDYIYRNGCNAISLLCKKPHLPLQKNSIDFITSLINTYNIELLSNMEKINHKLDEHTGIKDDLNKTKEFIQSPDQILNNLIII